MLNEHSLDIVERTVQLETDVAQLLDRGESAAVDRGMLENDYTILDATEGEKFGSIHEKCAAIVSVLRNKYSIDAEYTMLQDAVNFRRAANIGRDTSDSQS